MMVFLCLRHWLTMSQRFLIKFDTVDGKVQLHGTAIAVYQQELQNQTKVPIFQFLYLESHVNRILGLISPNIFKFADNYLLSREKIIIVHDNFLRKKCFSFYSLRLIFNVARVKLQELLSPIEKHDVISQSPKIFNIPAILDIFLISTLNTVLTAIIFGSIQNPSVHNQVIKYQLWQHTILY